jgi:hypothetical protein
MAISGHVFAETGLIVASAWTEMWFKRNGSGP